MTGPDRDLALWQQLKSGDVEGALDAFQGGENSAQVAELALEGIRYEQVACGVGSPALRRSVQAVFQQTLNVRDQVHGQLAGIDEGRLAEIDRAIAERAEGGEGAEALDPNQIRFLIQLRKALRLFREHSSCAPGCR
jgi:hypothetical protein